MGYSWGAYSVANVLNYYNDVKAVVSISGFNESLDMIDSHSYSYIGGFNKVALPFVKIHERIKFGKYAKSSAIDGFGNTDARVMIIHSQDDQSVPIECGYNKYYEKYSDDSRFVFKLFENRGHNYVFRSEKGAKYFNDFMNDLNNYKSSTPNLTKEKIINYIIH